MSWSHFQIGPGPKVRLGLAVPMRHLLGCPWSMSARQGDPYDRCRTRELDPADQMAPVRRRPFDQGLDIGATPRSSLPGMASIPETGFLVIADLTGYTAYLAGSEIEHAPAIAGDLLETIVGRPVVTVPADEVRGRCRPSSSSRRSSRRIPAARRDRGRLRRLSSPTSEHRPGDQLRMQPVLGFRLLSISSCSSTTGPFIRGPHRRSRRIGGNPRDPRSPPPEGDDRHGDARKRLRPVHISRRRGPRS